VSKKFKQSFDQFEILMHTTQEILVSSEIQQRLRTFFVHDVRREKIKNAKN